MIGFNNNISKPLPDFNKVLQQVNELDIFRNYIPDLKLNCAIISPFRKDEIPSFSVFWSHRLNKYLFKEHRYGWYGDCIDFVQRYFNLNSLMEATMKVCKDFNLDEYEIYEFIEQTHPVYSTSSLKVKEYPKKPNKLNIQIQVRDWNNLDIKYWLQYGITLKWLNLAHIYPIKYFWIEGNMKIADELAYAYLENKDGENTYKIYQPYNKVRKWSNNNDKSVWELWRLLPESHDFLIITKSRKDALSIMATLNIPATSLQAEGTIPKNSVIEELKHRFKYIMLLYDNDFDKHDNYGRMYGEKLSKKFNLPQIELPEIYGEKDYSDLVKKYGVKFSKNVLWFIIKQKYLKIKER